MYLYYVSSLIARQVNTMLEYDANCHLYEYSWLYVIIYSMECFICGSISISNTSTWVQM